LDFFACYRVFARVPAGVVADDLLTLGQFSIGANNVVVALAVAATVKARVSGKTGA